MDGRVTMSLWSEVASSPELRTSAMWWATLEFHSDDISHILACQSHTTAIHFSETKPHFCWHLIFFIVMILKLVNKKKSFWDNVCGQVERTLFKFHNSNTFATWLCCHSVRVLVSHADISPSLKWPHMDKQAFVKQRQAIVCHKGPGTTFTFTQCFTCLTWWHEAIFAWTSKTCKSWRVQPSSSIRLHSTTLLFSK